MVAGGAAVGDGHGQLPVPRERIGVEPVAAPAHAGEDFGDREFCVPGVGCENTTCAAHGVAAGPEVVLALEGAGQPFVEAFGSNGKDRSGAVLQK